MPTKVKASAFIPLHFTNNQVTRFDTYNRFLIHAQKRTQTFVLHLSTCRRGHQKFAEDDVHQILIHFAV